MAGKKHTIDMTHGTIWKLLVVFALPMLLGNLFQELYNTVDSIVIGNFVGKEALAAIGATTAICNTIIRFFNGISVGAGVVISRFFGAKNDKKLHQAVETIIAVSIVMGLLVTLAAMPLTPWMLRAMSTPEDVLGPASTYLQIYIIGIVFLFFYNMGSFILRAVGDTRRPLIFLIITSIVNIILDIVFVVGFGMGIGGTAWATVIAEMVSAVLVYHCLVSTEEAYCFRWRDICIDPSILKDIVVIGLPTGIQQGLTSFSNAFVQSYINGFDSSVMAGWSCQLKIDQFTLLPVQSIGQAMTTFVSQNLGAKKLERAKEGTRIALWMATSFMVSLSVLIYFLAGDLVGLFNRDASILYYGTVFVTMMMPFRFFSAWNQVYSGSLRGAGDAKGPVVIMLFSFVFCRQVYLFIITRFVYNVYSVGLGYPVGWAVCALLSRWYYRHSNWEKPYLVAKEAEAQ